MHRIARALMVAAVLMVAFALPAVAQDGEEAVRGTLLVDGEPVEGAVVVVETAEGQAVGEATSDEDGSWELSLPGPGTYRATLQEESLPEGAGLRDPDRATLEFPVRGAQQRTLIFQLGEREDALARWLPRVAQSAAHGLRFGLIIAMTAIGLSLIFGTTKLVNFSHGDMVTFGAVAAFFLNATGPRLTLVYAAALAVVVGGLLGAVLEWGLWRPLRARQTGLIQMLVISIGLALVLRHVILIFFGGRPQPYLQYVVQQSIQIGPIRMTPRDLVVMGLSVLVLVAVGLMLQRTRVGKAMRAVADNLDLAESSGIDVERVILLVWILGGMLTALGGVFLGVVENITWTMGFRLLLLMFAGVILGGLGTAFGAMVGSILIGLVTEMSMLFFPPEVKLVWALLVLVGVLLVRPQGIFGIRERVG